MEAPVGGRALEGRPVLVDRVAEDGSAVRGQHVREAQLEGAEQILLRGLALLQPLGADGVRLDEAHERHHHPREQVEVGVGRLPVLEAVA